MNAAMSYANIINQMRAESRHLLDRAVTTRGQRLVCAALLSDAADVLEKNADLVDRLADECEAWMNGVADVVEPLGYDRQAACGPSDLLPGLTELRNHGMENARRLAECVEARSYLYEQVVDMSALLDGAKRIAEPDPEPTPTQLRTLDDEGVCVRCGAPERHCWCVDVGADGHFRPIPESIDRPSTTENAEELT